LVLQPLVLEEPLVQVPQLAQQVLEEPLVLQEPLVPQALEEEELAFSHHRLQVSKRLLRSQLDKMYSSLLVLIR
jgi:hypothetical protein